MLVTYNAHNGIISKFHIELERAEAVTLNLILSQAAFELHEQLSDKAVKSIYELGSSISKILLRIPDTSSAAGPDDGRRGENQ